MFLENYKKSLWSQMMISDFKFQLIQYLLQELKKFTQEFKNFTKKERQMLLKLIQDPLSKQIVHKRDLHSDYV